MQITLAKITLLLLPECDVFLPASRSLVIADVHLGKSATFRTRGIPIPEGDTADDLARLDMLIKFHEPAELIIAGDLVHAADGLTPHIVGKLRAWLDELSIPVILTEGNHDRKSRIPDLPLKIVRDHSIGELTITHDPADLPPDRAGLAGHHHPAHRVTISHREHHRFKGFHLRHPHHLILPAFSQFTGTHPIVPTANDRFFAITPGKCHEIPLPPALSEIAPSARSR